MRSRHSRWHNSQVSRTAVDPGRTVTVSLVTAVEKFEQRFGKTVTLTEVSLEAEGHQYRYEISGVDDQQAYELTVDAHLGKKTEHEVHVNAKTGQVGRVEADD